MTSQGAITFKNQKLTATCPCYVNSITYNYGSGSGWHVFKTAKNEDLLVPYVEGDNTKCVTEEGRVVTYRRVLTEEMIYERSEDPSGFIKPGYGAFAVDHALYNGVEHLQIFNTRFKSVVGHENGTVVYHSAGSGIFGKCTLTVLHNFDVMVFNENVHDFTSGCTAMFDKRPTFYHEIAPDYERYCYTAKGLLVLEAFRVRRLKDSAETLLKMFHQALVRNYVDFGPCREMCGSAWSKRFEKREEANREKADLCCLALLVSGFLTGADPVQGKKIRDLPDDGNNTKKNIILFLLSHPWATWRWPNGGISFGECCETIEDVDPFRMAMEIYQECLVDNVWNVWDITDGGAVNHSWYSGQIESLEIAWNYRKEQLDNRKAMKKIATA